MDRNHAHHAEGERQGWINSNWCCAPRAEPEEVAQPEMGVIERNVTICYAQPQRVPEPDATPQRPKTSHSVQRVLAGSRDIASRASSRASMAAVRRRNTAHSRKLASISQPMDFRHLQSGLDRVGQNGGQNVVGTPRRRRSFRPLVLSIHVPEGHLSPLPDFDVCEWGPQNPIGAHLSFPTPARIRQDVEVASYQDDAATIACDFAERDARPFSVGFNHSTDALHFPATSLEDLRHHRPSMTESVSTVMSFESVDDEGDTAPLHPPSDRNSSLVARGVAAPQPAARRHSRSPQRSRSSSYASLRRPRNDVEDAIRELNTIVEEQRRVGGRSATPSPAFQLGHTPAIAPKMHMHVRTETLSDIGSAFSVPLGPSPVATPSFPKQQRPPRTSSLYAPSTPGSAVPTTPLRFPIKEEEASGEYFSAEDLPVADEAAPTVTTACSTVAGDQDEPAENEFNEPADPNFTKHARSFSRLSSWLRRLPSNSSMSSRAASTRRASVATNHDVPVPFYQCRPPTAAPPPPPPVPQQLVREVEQPRPEAQQQGAEVESQRSLPSAARKPRTHNRDTFSLSSFPTPPSTLPDLTNSPTPSIVSGSEPCPEPIAANLLPAPLRSHAVKPLQSYPERKADKDLEVGRLCVQTTALSPPPAYEEFDSRSSTLSNEEVSPLTPTQASTFRASAVGVAF